MPLNPERRTHLEHCVACNATLKSLTEARNEFAAMNTDIPEPDWDDFRSVVRSELLSRSVQRDSVVRRWTGWAIRPALAWALSLVLVIGITTGGFLWHHRTHQEVSTRPATVVPDSDSLDIVGIEAELSVWSQSGVFEELAQLETAEEEYLRQILQSAEQDVLEQK
jgi:hypothetical protein